MRLLRVTGTAVVNNRVIPVALVALLAYGCAAAFLHVYDIAIGTILLCFCEDYKVHMVDDPTQTDLHMEVYMPNSLRKIVLSSKEFKHMQKPMTQEQLMTLAGVDCRSELEKEMLTYPEVIDFCKKLLVKSDEFLHLGVPEDQLTERMIIDHTGGAALDKELKKHKNPNYDDDFAKAVARGDKTVKKDFYDFRMWRYKPQLNKEAILEIIGDAKIMDAHNHTLSQEDYVSHAKATHPDDKDIGERINSTPSRLLVRRMTQKKLGKNKVDPEIVETPVERVEQSTFMP